ncbi:hypothetical protein [Nocardioides humilatus]|nr:hypothetical protein [Nocardioides humilatus]
MQGIKRKRMATLALAAAAGCSVVAVSGGATVPPSASAATSYKLPWAAGETWRVNDGNHGAAYGATAWDFAPVDGVNNNPVEAVGAGTAAMSCTDAWGQATVRLNVGGSVFVYRHLTTASVQAFGITESGVSVQQGQILGRLHPDPPTDAEAPGHRCGAGTGPHLHLEIPTLPTTIDGYSFTTSSPGTGTRLLSSNGSGAGTATELHAGGHATISTPTGRVWSLAISGTSLKYRYSTSSSPYWTDWSSVSTGSFKSVAATVDGNGKVWILTTSTTGALRSATYDANTGDWTWSSSISTGYNWDNVAASKDGDGRVWMYATNTAGQLFYRHQTASGSSTWTSMDQIGAGDWAGISSTVKDGEVWVFAVKGATADAAYRGRIFYYKSTGTGTMGVANNEYGYGGYAGDVSVSTDKSGRVWGFATKTGGDLEYRYTPTEGGWTGPGSVGNRSWAGVSSAVKTDTGVVYVFATESGGELHYYKSSVGSDATNAAGGSWNYAGQVAGTWQ